MQSMNLDDAVALMRMEFAENPQLKLTFWQAQRLWNLSSDLCDRALTSLVRCGFLVQISGDVHGRRWGCATAATSWNDSCARADPKSIREKWLGGS